MTLRHHDLDVYPVTLHAAYSFEDWAELRNTIDSLAENIEARGHTSRDGVARDDGDEDCHVSIYVDPRHDTTDVIRTITHESVHAAGAVFDQIVAPIEPFSEPFAYLTDYIAGWLWDGLPPRTHDAKDTLDAADAAAARLESNDPSRSRLQSQSSLSSPNRSSDMSAAQSWQERVDNPDDPATQHDDPRFAANPHPALE